MLGAIVSAGKATVQELETYYSLEDAYMIMDILLVDAHNNRIMALKAAEEH